MAWCSWDSSCSVHCSSFLGLPYRTLIIYLVKPEKGTTMETIGKQGFRTMEIQVWFFAECKAGFVGLASWEFLLLEPCAQVCAFATFDVFPLSWEFRVRGFGFSDRCFDSASWSSTWSFWMTVFVCAAVASVLPCKCCIALEMLLDSTCNDGIWSLFSAS